MWWMWFADNEEVTKRAKMSDVSRLSAPFGFRFQVDIAAVFDMFKQPASTEMPFDELKAQNLPDVNVVSTCVI